ncbi:MAG: undecaprenyl/decaprenyl-phosphate alpha-N-acetylglucosaminyl 1-phosphate transferase [Bacteroidia bacterium]|nr:undecaprenyl/decaprenyl-phosphate alpha-N-acetylglucosaminyl 1-phosphate transferase [Bacteroidia bacterium]MCZ2277220.1 undecaprenyl/decaprenyl-phosphate alpha-N-acetylglucosaminyl 1-phosphate transferase [Bacteroidia bacterium]
MINIVFGSITAFIITFLSIPQIIKVSVLKGLFDEPNSFRKSHQVKVPTLGGLAIFAGVVFSFTFWSSGLEYVPTQYIIAAILVVFFVGIKDDIIELSAEKKLYGQIISALIIVLFGNIRITTFCGIFGIYDISYLSSVLFSVFIILLIINSVNLIDGIDGLAGGIGAITSFTFGLWFYNYEQIGLCILSFALFSSLLAFLVYNFSPANIFMGDTGSMVVGLILAILAINFIQLSFLSPPEAFPFKSGPAMAIAILIVPFVDTLRVFIIRLIHGKSPFKADRNHIHHVLLEVGMSHREVSLTLYLANICFIITALSLHKIGNITVLLLLAGLASLLLGTLFFIRHLVLNRNMQNRVDIAE